LVDTFVRLGERKVAVKSIKNLPYDLFDEFKVSEIFRETIALTESAISCKNDAVNFGVLKCYGLSKDPNTNSYLIITELCKYDLRKQLELNFGNLDWFEKLRILMMTANGLKTIHSAGLIHRDLHTGNILVGFDNYIYISDLGLSCYKDKDATNSVNFDVFIPKCYKELMEHCWDDDPSNRPDVNELYEVLRGWYLAGTNSNQFKEANSSKSNIKIINPSKQRPCYSDISSNYTSTNFKTEYILEEIKETKYPPHTLNF
ncbi:9887_t:CDS:2, partial [Dentiscutata heterogama]